ncbi:unnamed protein product [Boreogadus saida]
MTGDQRRSRASSPQNSRTRPELIPSLEELFTSLRCNVLNIQMNSEHLSVQTKGATELFTDPAESSVPGNHERRPFPRQQICSLGADGRESCCQTLPGALSSSGS